jgi:hypothetical protein
MTSLAELIDGFSRALHRRALAVLEPTSGDWHNQNTWGEQFSGLFPLSAGSIIQVLPKLDRMYGPPAVHSIQLARGDSTPLQNAEVRARVSYGCGGVNNSFDCDWQHGVQFALVCNSVNVSAVTYAPAADLAYATAGGSFFLGASVSKGTTESGAWPLTYTESTATLGLGTGADFPAQRDFTRGVTVHLLDNNNPATPTGVIAHFLSFGVELARYDLQVFAGGRAIPVPGGTTDLLINNTAGPVNAKLTVQWFLGL